MSSPTRPFVFSNEQTLPITGFNGVSHYLDYDFTPDSERLLMVFPANRPTEAGDESGEIVVVQHWFEELRRLPVG